MIPSKIQLVELTLIKSTIVENPLFITDKEDTTEQETDNFELQSAKTICPVAIDHLAKSEFEGFVQHRVRLGVRTPLKHGHGFPYSFEVIWSGIILNTDSKDGDPQEMAVKYGLALLYGAVRDHVFNLTARMSRGSLLVPTMSFQDETYEHLYDAHLQIEERKRSKAQPLSESGPSKSI